MLLGATEKKKTKMGGREGGLYCQGIFNDRGTNPIIVSVVLMARIGIFATHFVRN